MVMDLQTEDFMDMSYYPYAALSCASFLTFYRKVSPAVSVKYFPVYGSLPHAKQVEWNTRFVVVASDIIYHSIKQRSISTGIGEGELA